MHAYANRTPMDPPSARHADFDLAAAYAVEAERARWRLARGHAAIGRKVGFANKAMWRVLKLETLLWAHMYDDTVQYGVDGRASVSVARMFAPKIEPEIVFKLKRPIEATDAEAVLDVGLTDRLGNFAIKQVHDLLWSSCRRQDAGNGVSFLILDLLFGKGGHVGHLTNALAGGNAKRS